MRRHIIAALAATALVIAVGVAPTTLAQEDNGDDGEVDIVTEDTAPLPPPVAVELRLGERFSSAAWDIEAQSVFTAPGAEEKTEVRIAIAVRNNLELPLLFSDSSFVTDPAYPRLVLVDGAGVARPLSLVDMPAHSVGQADLRNIASGMTARWTVGFTVPSDAASNMSLVASDAAGSVMVEWDLSTAVPTGAWQPPSQAQTLALGETIDWNGAGLEVTPVDFGTLVCGDPDVEYVVQILALEFRVGNRFFPSDVLWPTSGFPDSAAVARWSNGSAAAEVLQTWVGTELPLEGLYADQIIIPSSIEPDYERALLFGVPRDGRLGSVDDPPDGVLLSPAAGLPRWLELSGPGTVPVNPALCDEDFFGFPQGIAFTPSVPFQVGEVPLIAETDDERDLAAQELIGQALIAASKYYQLNGSYAGMTSAALEATGLEVDFTNDINLLVPGVVAWDTLGPEIVIVLTESESGTFFCGGNEAGVTTQFGSGEDAFDTAALCVPPQDVAAEAAPDAGEPPADEEAP